jgi:hypothetical protein
MRSRRDGSFGSPGPSESRGRWSLVHVVAQVDEALDIGDALGRLEGEVEPLGGLGPPAL